MRTLLVTTLLVPCLAIAQTPLRPPLGPRARPLPGGPVGAPSAPAGPPPAAPLPGRPAPGGSLGGRPATSAPARPATPAGRAATPVRETRCQPLAGRFMLTFSKADIVDVLEQASRWTCRNFIYTDEVARGKITLLSKTPVTADEAYAAFLAALSSNNIAVYPTGKYWKLIRMADSKKTPIPTYVGDASGTPANEQPITKVIRLQYADADQLRGIMANFISPQGADIQAIPPDMLIITDLALNIRRIERLIDAIDKAGAGDLVRIIQVRYAPVKDIADKVNQIYGAQTGAAARPGRTVVTRGFAIAPGAVPGAPQPATGRAEEVSVSKIIPDERTNKLIVIADEKSFQRILDLVQQLDVPTATEGGIHVVFLKNANAEDLAQTLQSLTQGTAKKTTGVAVPAMPGVATPPAAAAGRAAPGASTAEILSGEVKVTADKAQNALIVQANGADFQSMSRLIEKLDRPRRQVFVEAVIMEVDLNAETQFGVGMHRLLPISYKGQTAYLPLASEPGQGRLSSLNLSSILSLGGFLTGFSGPAVADLGGLSSIGLVLQALQSDSDVNVLSTPHILASDNEESEIVVGQNVPFLAGAVNTGLSSLLSSATSGSSSTASSLLGTTAGLYGTSALYPPIQRQNVELRLKIKPQISEGDSIRLTIDEQTEEIASNDPQLGPTTAKRSVKTNIVAKDQSTIVIGGLIQERTVRSVKKVPFFGSLPILGWLFRDTDTKKTKTNLLLFLTPYIIRDQQDYQRIFEKKKREQEEFLEEFYGRREGFAVDVDYSRKPGPYALLRRDVEEEANRVENGGPGLPSQRIVTPSGAGPAGATPATPPAGAPTSPAPAAPAPRAAPEPPDAEGTPVDRLEVQPEVPAPGGAPSSQGSAPSGQPAPATPPPAAPGGE